ncbi:MAG: hypothetical protein IJ666_04250, partial [Ruminococcus sp.]|nr:hypothetical protein [Ruminococcus sp.]
MNVRKKTFGKRFLGMMIAFFMVFTSVPMNELVVPDIQDVRETQAQPPWSPWGGFGSWGFGFPMPNVMTNATVVFKDNDGNVITETESGESFKMVLTISANNSTVNGKSTYRINVPDSILLTNFRGNGFVDGMKYNGYTLHYNAATGERYVEFSVKNGATETIQLSGKFANGITENGTTATVKVVNPVTQQSNSSTIKAIAKSDWTDDKTTSETLIETKDFADKSISFNLSAAPAGNSGSTGVLWADHIVFTDTLTLPAGLTFKSKSALESALSISGVTVESIELSGDNKAVIKWTTQNANKDSKNVPTAEMDAFSAVAQLSLNCIDVSESFEKGSIENTLGAEVFGYNSKSGTALTDKSASVPVKSSVEDVSDLKKELYSISSGRSYAMDGDTAVFRITNTNTGGRAVSNFTITETPDPSLEFVEFEDNGSTAKITFEGNSIKAASFGAGEKIDVYVSYKIKSGTPEKNIPNTVKNSKDFSSTAYVPVKETKTDFSIVKTADTALITSGTEKDVTYRIVVSNTGTTTLTGLTLSDALDGKVTSADIKSITVSDGTAVTDTDLADGLDAITLKDLEPEQSVTVDMVVALTAEGEDDEIISNTATVTDGSTSKKSNADIKIHVGKPDVIANKSGSVTVTDKEGNTSVKSFYQNGSLNRQDIVYTITIANNGDAAAENVEVSDEDIAALKEKLGSDAVVTIDGETINLPHKIEKLAPGKSAVVKITFSGVEAELTATEDGGTDLKNTAKVNDKEVTDTIEVKPAQAIVGINKFAVTATYNDGLYRSNHEEAVEWYRIKVSNTGTLTSKSMTVTDKLPEWLEDATYWIKYPDGNWSDEIKYPADGIIELDPLEPNKAYEIAIWGYMKDGTDGKLGNTAGLSHDGENYSSSVDISKTEFNPGDFKKTARVIEDGKESKYLDVTGGTVTYDLTYTGKNYTGDGENQFAFGITFTDYLPTAEGADGSELCNIKSVKLIIDGGEEKEINAKEYLLDGNKFTYVWDKNTNPANYVCEESAVLRIEYKVDNLNNAKDGAPAELINKAQANIAGKILPGDDTTSDVTTPVVDTNAMKVDKFAKQEGSLTEVPDKLSGGVIDEETGLVSYNKDITYYITVTNNSGKPMYKLNLYDKFSGTMCSYEEMEWIVADISGESVLKKGDTFKTKAQGGNSDSSETTAESCSAELRMFVLDGGSNWANAVTTGENGFSLALSSEKPVLSAGEHITFAYRLKTSKEPYYTYNDGGKFTNGTNTVYASYSGDVEILAEGSPFEDEINYKGSSPSLFKSIGDITIDDDVPPENGYGSIAAKGSNLSDKANADVADLANAEISDITSKEYSYVVAVINKTAETTKNDYSEDVTYVIEDAVPEGMQLVDGSVYAFNKGGILQGDVLNSFEIYFKQYSGQDWETKEYNTQESYKIADKDIQIQYTKDGKVNFVISNTALKYVGNTFEDYGAILVTYKLRFTESMAASLINEKKESGSVNTEFVNSAVCKIYTNYGTAAETEINETNENDAVLEIREETIAPDIQKTAEGVDDIVAPDDSWTTGAKWTVKVTNEDLADYEIADAVGFVVYDDIQAGSRFYGIATGEVYASDYPELMKATYKTSGGDTGEVQAYFTKEDGTIDISNPVTDPKDTDGKTIAFDFSDMTLKAGEYVEITFCTSTAKEFTDEDDETYWASPVSSIQNTAKVKFNNGFSSKTVGTDSTFEGDKTVSDTENYQIGGLITKSYKTIEYKHSSMANSPDNAKGFGDNIKHESLFDNSETEATNYVQGLQGDYVEYTINVKNDAATTGKGGAARADGASTIDRFSIIDRLPYVGDTGIVSGYDRFTAFPVELDAENGFVVKLYNADGTEKTGIDASHYTVSYSNSTASINETAGDWRGADDAMTWSDTYDKSMVNFRIVFDDTVKIAPQEYISIEFRGIVSPFTDITAEDEQDAYENDKIAWNSFAYSYQTNDKKTGLSPDETVVSEPARVGVWVKKTDTEITLNKTYKTNSPDENTFYFSLFTKENGGYKIFGQPKAVTMTGSETGNTETLKFSNLIAQDTLYLFETDKAGNIIKSTPEQKVTYGSTEYTDNEELENVLETSQTSLTVDITNEAIIGKINLTKTFVPAEPSLKKTFYFGVFAGDGSGNLIKENDSYKLVGDVQSLTIQGGAADKPVTGELTFSNLPIAAEGTSFYVLETDAKGNITPDALDGDKVRNSYIYKAPDGSQYDVTGGYSADLSKDSPEKSVSVTNTEKKVMHINVSKSYDGNEDDTFRIGIFEIAEENAIAGRAELTDEDLEKLDSIDRTDLSSFTAAKDENGNDLIKTIKANSDPVTFDILNSGNYYVFEIDADNQPIGHGEKVNDYTVKYNESANITAGDEGYRVSYTPLTLSNDNPDENVTIENTTEKILPTLSVTKVLSIDGYEDASGKAEYTFGVFEAEKYTQEEADEYNANVGEDEKVSAGSTKFDSDGNAIINETPVDVKVIDPATGEVSGTAVKNFTISADAVNGKTSSASAYVQLPEIEFTDLEPRIYYVFELDGSGNRAQLGGTVEANITGAEGAKAVVNYSPANGVVISQTSTNASAAVQNQVTKESEISFMKWNDTGDVLEGAVLQLTGEKISAEIENTVCAGETITAGGNEFTVADNSVAWITGTDKFTIKGLADGEYTISEIYAPEGYTKTSDKTFTISGGYIDSDNLDDEQYTFTANSVSVVDKKKSDGITISKKDITGENEVKGATITIRTQDNTEIGTLTATGTELTEVKDGDTVTGYSFVSNGSDVIISGLAEGTYILEETAENGTSFTAEDGNEYYIITSQLTFDIDADGNITNAKSDAEVLETADGTQTDGYYVVNTADNSITVCDAEKIAVKEYEISKQDAVSGEEISGAKLTISKTGDVDEDNQPVYTDENGEEIATSVVTSWITPDAVVATETTVVDGEVSYVTVTDADGNPVKTVPTVSVTLDDGVYELEEVTAPDGYKTAEKIYFAVRDGKIIYSGSEKPENAMTDEAEKVTMLDQPSKVIINKTDITGNTEVDGAEITLTYDGSGDISKVILTSGGKVLTSGTDYTIDTENKTISWKSKDNAVEIEYIPNGDYKLKETGGKFTSSDGNTYKIIDSLVSFTVADGEITSVSGDAVKNEKAPGSSGYVYYNADDENITDAKNTITLCDAEDTNKISISKQDAVTGSLIDGARLIISKVGDITENGDKITVNNSAETSVVAEYDTAYETVTFVVTDTEGNTSTVAVTDENGEAVTTIADKEFELTDGVYELTEVSAPEGYQVAETIYFVVKDGKVVYSDTNKPTEITAEDMGNKVIMEDQPNSAAISKQDASNGGKELAGAVISITAPENADLSHIYLKRGGTYLENGKDYTVDGNKITFTSGDEKTVVYGLASGNYKLTEDTAPLGYNKDTMIEFAIDKNGDVKVDDNIIETLELTDKVIGLEISKVE